MYPDLLKDMSGEDERGVKPPLIRIPNKTYLSGVLLNSNPWEKRDLDRKLDRIKRERIRREKTLDWSQRQFFMKQIFDQESNLRFPGKSQNDDDTDDLTGTNREGNFSSRSYKTPRESMMNRRTANENVPQTNKEASTQGQIVRLPNMAKAGLGIFTEKSTLNAKHSVKSSPRTTALDDILARKSIGNMLAAVSLPVLNQSSGKPAQPVRNLPADRLGVGREHTMPTDLPSYLRNDEDENRRRESFKRLILSKAISLPNINLRHIHTPEVAHEYTESSISPMPKETSICDQEVISRLTQTLPVSLMIKANQNVNKVIDHQKQGMLLHSKKGTTKNMFSDPRWKRLTSTLVESGSYY